MDSANNSPYTYAVGPRIRHFRTLKGISVNKLANMSGISQSYLRDIELENKNPSVEILALICQALGITLSDFFDEKSCHSFFNNQLIQTIYQLSPEQQRTLQTFLDSMLS